ncbi:hypothetical protein BBK36DRAFT_49751 [Trichoderma citrinoviride]|uniref:G-patch domain-containing protein n=1 Tax=Trichoderma citrinoviride TaxID=58853 RepID=A0A2T4BEZ1_9HYPO|nr:hypothetical protein BBK36DRAFT_49751 [Trichoderma citrinoviride]PTB67907.1 hypothetical protein BBK36DRAFT_49751 [Trichoderma citrinoviride]
MYNDDYHRGRHEHQARDNDYASSSSYRDRRYPSRSPPPDYYSRSRSRSPPREGGGRLGDAGLPSDTVIFEGLPVRVDGVELRESIIRDCISDDYSVVDVRLTYAKGKRRAFIQFEDVDHATAFVNEHFPKVLFTLPHTTDEVPDGKCSAYIHFAHRRADGDTRAGGQWVCLPCGFENYSSRTKCKRCGSSPLSSAMRVSLNPAADAADAPTQILVVYPLMAYVTEEMFAADMKRLELAKPDPASQKLAPGSKLQSTAPADRAARTGARPGSLHRVFLMRDSVTDESVKYGFAEFWTLQDAVDAMAKIKLLPSFSVAAAPVIVSHIHLGVFVPEEREITPEMERFSFSPLFNPTLRVRYRDLRAYPSQKILASEPPGSASAAGEQKGGDQGGNNKKPKKRKADDPLGATAKKAVPAMAGHMALWQKKHEEIHTNESGTTAAKQLPVKDPKEAPIKFAFKGASAYAPGAQANSASPPAQPAQPAPPAPSSAPPPLPPPEKQNGDKMPAAKPDVQAKDEKPITPYADREKLQCLLCMRKFKSLDELSRHGSSQLHAEKLQDEQSVKSALERLSKRGIPLPTQTEAGDDASHATAPQYRDRAKERREQWNQPKKPLPVVADKSAPGPPKDQGKASSAPEKAPARSKGAGMLAKMGWTSGSGLGANAEGRTESIVTHVYRQGVGLGAEGANMGNAQAIGESRTVNNRKDYVDAVNERARERFFSEFGGEKKDGQQNGEDKDNDGDGGEEPKEV